MGLGTGEMMQTSVRGGSATAFAVGVLLLAAACGSSPQTPNVSPASPATVTGAATTPAPSTQGRTPTTGTGTSPASTATPAPKVTTHPSTSTPPSPKPTTPASTSVPTAPIPPSLIGHVVSRIPTSRRVVALTFDAGANGDAVSSILATLSKEKVAASFYLTGDFVNSFPTLAVRMAAAGRVGNHTADHPHLPLLTEAQARAQVTSARTTILRVTGEDPRPLFRFPFGDSGPRDLRMVNDLGYVAVGWTIDTLGWQGTSGGRSADSVVQRVLAAATPGEIVLMHVGSHPTDHSTLDADALPRVIAGLRAAGYSFVTLDALGAG
jgi:peptidoglycan/xylan/chitin deacetylase (PgdA/CDA1 family)